MEIEGKPRTAYVVVDGVQLSAPRSDDPPHSQAKAYLRPSGKVKATHPVTGEVWLESDQAWLFTTEEVAAAKAAYPDRVVECVS